jgi:hypothetical protein
MNLKIISLSLRVSMLVCLVCTVAIAHAQEAKPGKTITRNGNIFLLSATKYDTVYTQTATEEVMRLMVTDPFVLTMNGEKVYDIQEVTTRAQNRTGKRSFEQYVLGNLNPLMKKLPSGKYNLLFSDVIVDRAGKIVYYQYYGLHGVDGNGRNVNIPDSLDKEIKAMAEKIVSKAPWLVPAKVGNKNVIANYLSDIDEYTIDVTEGVVTWAKKGE